MAERFLGALVLLLCLPSFTAFHGPHTARAPARDGHVRRESFFEQEESGQGLSRRALALEVAATAAALLASDSAAAIPLPIAPAGITSAASLDTTSETHRAGCCPAHSSLWYADDASRMSVTHVVDLKLRIAAIQASRSEDGGRNAEQGDAIDGSMRLGLYGNAAPKTVRNFLTYCVPGEVLDSEGNLKRQPSYASSILGRMEPVRSPLNRVADFVPGASV